MNLPKLNSFVSTLKLTFKIRDTKCEYVLSKRVVISFRGMVSFLYLGYMSKLRVFI